MSIPKSVSSEILDLIRQEIDLIRRDEEERLFRARVSVFGNVIEGLIKNAATAKDDGYRELVLLPREGFRQIISIATEAKEKWPAIVWERVRSAIPASQ